MLWQCTVINVFLRSQPETARVRDRIQWRLELGTRNRETLSLGGLLRAPVLGLDIQSLTFSRLVRVLA